MTPATKKALDQSCNSIEGKDQNTFQENRPMTYRTPSLARPGDTGPAIVDARASGTVLVPGWHPGRWRTPGQANRYHLVWCEEPWNEWHPDAYDAMPLDAWQHLAPEAREVLTTPGYQWGDDPLAPERDGEFRITYLGVYELIASGGDRWDRTAFGVFRRVAAAES